MMELKEYYYHIKTGNFYRVFAFDITDATNATDGRKMVLYQNHNGDMFVREQSEFNDKFAECNDQKIAGNFFKNAK